MEIEVANLSQNNIITRVKDKIIIDFKKISEYDLDIALKIEKQTKEFLKEVKNRFKCKRVHLHNFGNFKIDISNLRVKNIGELVSIKGMVAQATKPIALVKNRIWECTSCGSIFTTLGEQPRKCSCQNNRFIEKNTILEDIQEIEIEEMQEEIEDRQPEKVRVRLPWYLTSNDLTGIIQPGNKIEIIGIVEKIPMKKNRSMEEEIFDYRIYALDMYSLEEGFDDNSITEKEIEEIEAISVDNPLEKLKNSLAPSIHGHDEIKKTIILQMVGGVKKHKAGVIPTRDRIHLLLIGDPGTSKTQLGKNTHLRTPRSYYLSGESASKAGLTATVEQDALLGSWGLRAGAICKCNGSILVLDECDKLDKEDRKALHTPMESGEVVINKATIHAKLKADCSILAIANPKSGMFEIGGSKTIVDQIDLPAPLISRFDIVFMMKDKINKAMDKEIAEIIYTQKSNEFSISVDLFRKYIIHAKTFKPKLKAEHLEELSDFYHKVRKQSIAINSKMTGMPITPRHLEGIIRMAEASAKIRLSNEVSLEDIKLAQGLFYESLIKLGLDEETGLIDLARFGSGKTISKKKKSEVILEIFNKCKGNVLSYKELQSILHEKGENFSDYEKVLEELNRDGTILKQDNGWTLS